MHGIVWSNNVSNGSKSTHTGINAQNLNGLSEKVTVQVSLSVSVVKTLNSSIVDLFCTHAAVTHSSWQFLMFSRASRMTMSLCWTKLTNAKSLLLTWKKQILAASCSMLNVLWPVTNPMQSSCKWHQLGLWLQLHEGGLISPTLLAQACPGRSPEVWWPQRSHNWLVTPKRTSLNPEKVKQLIVIKCNMQLLRQGRLFDFMDIVFDFKLNWQWNTGKWTLL